MLANFGTVLPIEVFADNEPENLVEQSLESYGHRYQLFDSSMTWYDAKLYCESIGGHLATVTSNEEQQMVESILSTGTGNNYWLGGSLGDDSTWRCTFENESSTCG